MRPSSRLGFLIAVAVFCASASAFGSGFSIFEQGAKATAMGGAFAATADDPSAIFYNVAGIAQQRHFTVLAGGTAINFANQFRGSSTDPFTSGTSGKYREHLFVPPNAYVVVPVGSNLTFGLGVFTPFGLRTDWAQPFPGRFVARDTNLKTLSIEPAIAWQSSDGRFALGAGYEHRRAHVQLSRNNGVLNPFTQRFADVANVYLSSKWHSDSGYNVGLLFKPTSTWRFGASYRSDMDIKLSGNAKFTQIPTGSPELDAIVGAGLPPNQRINTTISFPSTLIAGVATTAITNWDVEADITRTTWNRFKNLDINFETTPAVNLHREEDWKNTYSYRLGGNRRIGSDWDVRLGAVYDENPQPTKSVSPLLPDSDRAGVAFGVGYHKGPWIIDATEFVLHFMRRGTFGQSQDNFNGEYKTDANLISFNIGYRF